LEWFLLKKETTVYTLFLEWYQFFTKN
jgi:hypothetical protein